jgi:tetratricopeptide (TPR) repeat protein
LRDHGLSRIAGVILFLALLREVPVFESAQPLRHMPFFSEIASLNEHDPEWRSTAAGLVLLRLVDAWIDEGPAVAKPDGWAVRNVAATIDEMPDGVPARAILRSTLDSLTAAPTVDMHTVTPRLMAYARTLDADAKYALAADVYETIIAYSHPTEDADEAINAHVRLSYCHRMLGELQQAEDIAMQAGRIAAAAGDLVGVLRSRIAEAKVSTARGNYPKAEQMLDAAIDDARSAGLEQMHAHVIQERAGIAQLKGDYEYAIKLGYDALDRLPDRDRDRMLGDIAGAFYMLGIRSAARDAYTLLSVTAQEQYVRWTSRINLMEIAADDGLLQVFQRHQRYLENAHLPPLLRAEFLLHAGEGLIQLGLPDDAKRHLTDAMALAAQYGYNRLVFHAEEQLESLAAPRVRNAESPIPEALAPIAEAMRHRHAGVISLH